MLFPSHLVVLLASCVLLVAVLSLNKLHVTRCTSIVSELQPEHSKAALAILCLLPSLLAAAAPAAAARPAAARRAAAPPAAATPAAAPAAALGC